MEEGFAGPCRLTLRPAPAGIDGANLIVHMKQGNQDGLRLQSAASCRGDAALPVHLQIGCPQTLTFQLLEHFQDGGMFNLGGDDVPPRFP